MYNLDNEAQLQLTYFLRLPATGREQDWDIELADSQRLDEFIALWDNVHGSLPLKRALAALLIASYDDYLQTEPDEDVYGSKLYQLLSGDRDMQDIIDYWALSSEADSTDWFQVTPFARRLIHG